MSDFGTKFNDLLSECRNEMEAAKHNYNLLYRKFKTLKLRYNELKKNVNLKVQKAVDVKAAERKFLIH